MKARTAHIQTVLSGDFKTAWEAKLKAGGLTGSSGEFSLIMSALKRDNGIIAIDYDLFAMARDNLEEAVEPAVERSAGAALPGQGDLADGAHAGGPAAGRRTLHEGDPV